MRILVFEPDIDPDYILKSLAPFGNEFVRADSYAHAVELLDQHSVDLIVLSANMAVPEVATFHQVLTDNPTLNKIPRKFIDRSDCFVSQPRRWHPIH